MSSINNKTRKQIHEIIETLIDVAETFSDDEENENETKGVMAEVNTKENKVIFHAEEKEFHPKFLKYLLESMGLPKDIKVEFKKETRNEN